MDPNKLVWFADSKHGYSIGRIVDISRTNVSVQPVAVASETSAGYLLIDDPTATSLDFPYKSVYPCDQLSLEALRETQPSRQALPDVDDNCALIHLNEAALLENVRLRFHRDKIYTYVAHILIAVNPYFQIKGLHSPEAILNYQGKSLGTLPPHVYAIADKAYRDMKAFKRSQSIIINGESGAGKTESQKYVLRYLCLSGSQSGRLEKLILDANPLLEAFGNAKTIRNNNSSRFGKFIEVHYSNKFTVTGGLFLHYLLEKSRICTQSAGERNYHIFYQLCACLPDELWRELRLGSPDKFRYLNGGCTQYFCSNTNDLKLDAARKSRLHISAGAIQDQLIDDLDCYLQTDGALSNFGLNEGQKRAIYRIVAAVLHLGNITFEDDPDDNRGGCRLAAAAEQSLEITSQLMGLEADQLRQSLVSRIMSTARSGHKGTVYMVQLSAAQAQAARDALAKAIYSRLFDHIVAKIVNKSIPASSPSAYYIGVLDVAGFEYFQHNSFEQFLINFCNEKLQQFFNERILKEEQSIYEKEGLQLKRVEFTDNQDCIQLFEAKAAGIFDLLDEESRLPKPSWQHFTQAVHAANKSHFRLAVPRTSKLKAHRELRDDEGFLVRHFAGAVCYETHSFIDKNNDALHASLRNLMLEANNEMLRDLFVVEQQANQQQQPIYAYQSASNSQTTNKLNFISVGTTFRSQLNDLMGKLRSTGSHFIRCVKPNSEMVAHKFEGGQILSQLHCSGMDSVLELMQQGFPSRLSFNDLYEAYKRFLPAELARLDSHLFCRALFKAIGLAERDFRFGCSKVFFRPGKFAQFDQIVRTDGEHVAELIRAVSKWLTRSRWRKAQYCCLSVVKLERKIVYRRNLIVRLQRNWRTATVMNRLKFRLDAIRAARLILASLEEFETIAAEQLKRFAPAESSLIEEQTRLLKQELASFVASLTDCVQQQLILPSNGNNNNNNNQLPTKESPKDARTRLAEAKERCKRDIERLSTKRDLLIRSIRDKIANKEREFLELERRMSAENKRREEQELVKRREEEIKLQRNELEARRQLELKQQQQQQQDLLRRDGAASGGHDARKRRHLAAASSTSDEADQERRDYEIACRLANETSSSVLAPSQQQRSPQSRQLAPSENHARSRTPDEKYDLTKWKYSDLRDTINTSCDLELLEACKREFHRRLKVYHAWRAMNSSRHASCFGAGQTATTSPLGLRAPTSVMQQAGGDAGSPLSSSDEHLLSVPAAGPNEQRYFRIPFVRPAAAPAAGQRQAGGGAGQRGWWFAHFDGQWIARQLELHPDREPILLIAGQHDIEMCELSLRETRLSSKRGAEILPQEFEEEWAKHGGQAYRRGHTGTMLARK